MPGNSGSEQIRSARRLAHGQAARPEPEVGVGLGEVNRRGVVNSRGHPARLQVLAQLVAKLAPNDEQVVDVIGLGERQVDEFDRTLAFEGAGGGEPGSQLAAEAATLLVPILQAPELASQDSRLQGVQPRRRPDDAVVVARTLAVGAQQPHALGELRDRGHHRAAVAPGAEVLRRVEAEAAASRRPSRLRRPR